jgi:hypothetical protein
MPLTAAFKDVAKAFQHSCFDLCWRRIALDNEPATANPFDAFERSEVVAAQFHQIFP